MRHDHSSSYFYFGQTAFGHMAFSKLSVFQISWELQKGSRGFQEASNRVSGMFQKSFKVNQFFFYEFQEGSKGGFERFKGILGATKEV